MLDSPPGEPRWRSWTWVVLWILVIYATIPLARRLVASVDNQFGREVFLYLCLLPFAYVGFVAWRSLRSRQPSRSAYLCLLSVLLAFAFGIYQLRDIPEEALHVVQYALLSLLFYRALSHRLRDYTIFPLAVIATGMVGIVDEYVQWVVPDRYYDVADIRINFFAGLLCQVGLASGLRPRLVAHRPPPASWRRLGYVFAAGLLLLSISFVNTPQRVTWYAQQLPGLEFLLDGSSMMAQFGYRHRSPGGGEFFSRFSSLELAALDQQRGAEVAGIIDQLFEEIEYRDFLARYSILRDPYVHEIGVRVYRRKAHREYAAKAQEEATKHYTIAYHENDILQTFYPTTLKASRFAWNATQSAQVETSADLETPYLSKVSSALITRLSETQVWLIFATAITLVVGVGHLLAWRQGSKAG